jgi:hypothetical protein
VSKFEWFMWCLTTIMWANILQNKYSQYKNVREWRHKAEMYDEFIKRYEEFRRKK